MKEEIFINESVQLSLEHKNLSNRNSLCGQLLQFQTKTLFYKTNTMGQTLDTPVSEKETHRGSNDFSTFGCSCMQGYRISMEDRHNNIAKVEFSEEKKKQLGDVELSFYAVYDGHSG